MDRKIKDSVLKRRRRCKLFRITVAVALIVTGVFCLVKILEKSVDARNLILATVDTGEIETTVTATGLVVPAFEEIINSPVTTRLLAIYAMAGDTVKAGIPLLGLDLESEQTHYDKMRDSKLVSEQELEQMRLQSRNTIDELSMQISIKEMDVSCKHIDFINESRLDSLGSGTGDRVRLAEQAWHTAELELHRLRDQLANEKLRCEAAEQVSRLRVSSIDKDLDMIRATLKRGEIIAPHDGILTYIVTGIGAQISAGEKVAVVSNLSSFRILGEIAERASERISVGSRAVIRIGNAELPGTVSNITPQAKSGTVQFIVNPDDPCNTALRSGVRAELYISYAFHDNVVRLPAGSYYSGVGECDLFVVEGAYLKRRRVRLGESSRRHVEVVSGLQPGDVVAVGDMSAFTKYSTLKIR